MILFNFFKYYPKSAFFKTQGQFPISTLLILQYNFGFNCKEGSHTFLVSEFRFSLYLLSFVTINLEESYSFQHFKSLAIECLFQDLKLLLHQYFSDTTNHLWLYRCFVFSLKDGTSLIIDDFKIPTVFPWKLAGNKCGNF